MEKKKNLLNKGFKMYNITRWIKDNPDKTSNLDIFRLEVTLEKLKNTHIVGFGIGGHCNVGNGWGAFLFNENTDYFYSIVKRSGVVI